MRIAPSGRFSREAREPDQHHRSIWLLASPHRPDMQNRQNLGRLGCSSVISLTWAKACVDTLHMSQNNLRLRRKGYQGRSPWLVSGSSKSLKVSNIDQRVSARNVRLHYHGIYR